MTTAVLMAGGEGLRLRPLTLTTPKPMLPVGGKPLLETLVRQLVKAGVTRVFLVVRYLAEQIEAHFGDGADLGVEIHYLREPEPYGTAGGLSLIPTYLSPDGPFVVVNADILCPFDFAAFREFHIAHGNVVTLVGRTYTHTVPFGYPVMSGDCVVDFREKPVMSYRVNSGIYCLDEAMLAHVVAPMDMPDLIRLACSRYAVGLYPLPVPFHEIGRVESYYEAEEFYGRWMR